MADGAMAFGTHAGVDQDLRHGGFGCRGFLTLVGFMNRLDEVQRVVVGNVLQAVCNTLNEIVLANDGHGPLLSRNTAWVSGCAKRPDFTPNGLAVHLLARSWPDHAGE